MYKLIACDMDGTLLDKNFKFSHLDKEAIAKAQEKGVIFALCSGRSYKSLRGFAKELGINPKGNYIVGFNGGLVYDMENETVAAKYDMDKDIAVQVVKIYDSHWDKHNMEIIIYIDGESVIFEESAVYAREYQKTSQVRWCGARDVLSDVQKLDHIAKIIFIGENAALQSFEKELKKAFGNRVNICFSAEYLLEVGPVEHNKGSGIEWLCNQFNINLGEVIAIGDNHNDLPMIEKAGLGVAVANAAQAAKEIADYITENDCSNGAVAEVIGKFVL